MAYIIEHANILKESNVEQASILINEDRIELIRPSFERYSYMRFNASSFIMTAPHIIFDPNLPFEQSFQRMRQYYMDAFLKKGSTLFLCYASIEKEYLFRNALIEIKKRLLNSPIDFIVGVKIPVKLLTPSFMRRCKKEKTPAIFVEITDIKELYEIQWGWVREAMFPYNSPLIPIFKQDKPRLKKQAQTKWLELLTNEKIPFIENEMEASAPISSINLMKMGILPLKSALQQGSEVSYNLYLLDDEDNKIEESALFHYHNHRLAVTVHKGTVIRAGEKVLFRPGFGEQVMIQTPSFFTSR
ncbi:hypothetical protein [Bacillus dakarensis]|uniref:hypothetical protein n=1 Tax=Robertmurraya dakarensis TaxID=1926278 RepID=UPI0009825681|nr:hypothetical protein [Bacillus dakarensis]